MSHLLLVKIGPLVIPFVLLKLYLHCYEICFIKYFQKINKKTNLRWSQEGERVGGRGRYDHDHRFNGIFIDGFPTNSN